MTALDVGARVLARLPAPLHLDGELVAAVVTRAPTPREVRIASGCAGAVARYAIARVRIGDEERDVCASRLAPVVARDGASPPRERLRTCAASSEGERATRRRLDAATRVLDGGPR